MATSVKGHWNGYIGGLIVTNLSMDDKKGHGVIAEIIYLHCIIAYMKQSFDTIEQ